MRSGLGVWLEEKMGWGGRTEPELSSLSFSIASMPLWPLVASGRARWTCLHQGHQERYTHLRFYMANRAHPSPSSPPNTTEMKRDMYEKEKIHCSIRWPASLRKSRWVGRTENLIRAQSVSPNMDKGRPTCRTPRKLAQRQGRAGRMGFLRATDNEWMLPVARNTTVGAQGRGQKPPAETPYCLREHDLLPRDSSPGRWIDCSLQKCAEGSISSSLILLPHLNIPHHCFHRSGTAVVYSLHDPSQALRWHTCLRDFQRSTKSRSCLLPPDMPRRYRRVSDALTLTQWVMNSASSLTASIQILRIKLTLGLTSTSLTARGQQSQDYRDRGETVKTLRTVTQPSLKAKQRSTKNRMPPTYLFFKKKLLKELLQQNKNCIRISNSRKVKAGYAGNNDEQWE